MCGIAGFYHANINDHQLDKIFETLHHRGPDDQGFYRYNNVGLVHTRLSVIELSNLGSQPYRFKNLVAIFNGELYNYKEIRDELKKSGYSFQSNSDTEVLIKAFHFWGESCVDHFIGMFAFGIYNEYNDEIYLFRDRVGVKPLYYSYENGAFFFASELKALSVFPISKEINLDSVSAFFRFGFIPNQLSIFKSASKLEPGHLLKVSRHGITKKKYWNPSNEIIHNRTEADWIDKLEELLIDAFKYRMVSDVPVGVFLSGGIDSSLLTAILQKHHRGINTFTIGFEESEFDESNYAKKIAELLQTNHYQKNLTLSDAKQVLDQYYSIYDEPFADTSGIPTACVAAFAKKNGMKVVLSADGGDELFGGYTHYPKAIALFNKFASLPKIVRAGIAKGSRILLPPAIRSKVYPFNTEHRAYALEELATAHNPIKFFESFIANQTLDEISRMIHSSKFQYLENSTIGSDPLQTMMAWDFQYYLPDDLLVKVDRATMFHSIECREPFLDHRLVEFARRIPNELRIKHGKGKYLLQQLLNRYLPLSYFERKKQGFSIPVFAWFKRELDELFAIYLTKEKINPIPFLDFEEIQKEYDKYKYFKKRGKQYNIEKMWRVLSFLMWWDKYMIDED